MTTTFDYRGRSSEGVPVSGSVDARSEQHAMERVQSAGAIVTDLRPTRDSEARQRAELSTAARQVKRSEVISFANQLAVMLETGVPIGQALQAYLAQSRTGALGRVVADVADRVGSGEPLSRSMERFPRVFPTLMVSLVHASEASGSMGPMLRRIVDYLSRERRTIKQIRGALTYPSMMIALATLITGFLVTWVLPRFAKIYESREESLPAITRVVLGTSRLLTEHWMPIVGTAAAVALLGTIFLRTRAGRRLVDGAKIRLPVIGPMFTLFYLTRAMRTLGTLLTAGVGILDALRIVRGVTANALWEEQWDELEAQVTSGNPIAEVFGRSSLVPPTVAQMLAAGEQAGRLPDVLERIAEAAQEDLDEAVKQGTQLLEPAMILFMGVTIGTVAIALLLPIFSVADTIGR